MPRGFSSSFSYKLLLGGGEPFTAQLRLGDTRVTPTEQGQRSQEHLGGMARQRLRVRDVPRTV